MRLGTYLSSRGPRAGVLRGDRVIDAWDVLEPGAPESSVRELLAHDVLDRLAFELGGEGVPLDGLPLDVPVPDPEKILCIGLNYRSHAAEAGIDPPRSEEHTSELQ